MIIASPTQESNCVPKKVRVDSRTGRVLSPLFKKPKQIDRKAPKFLTERQVEELIQIAFKGGQKWNRKRNALMLMMLFRHGLRRGELIDLRWSQINIKDAQITICRLKNGKMSIHPIPEREIRMINEHQKTATSNVFVFSTLDGTPFSPDGIRKVIYSIAEKSKIPFRVHPHMFRHACGFYLANNGVDTRAIQAYMGHVDIKKTVIYTEMAPNRFNDFWKE